MWMCRTDKPHSSHSPDSHTNPHPDEISFFQFSGSLNCGPAQASRLPKASWEQMMPKKLPTPSSAPSKGTNSVATATISSSESKQKLRSADKNV
ncbi:hypothetical protein ACET3Z_017489 [Daucus carota]